MNEGLALLVPVLGAVFAAFVLYRFVIRKRTRVDSFRPDPAVMTLTANTRGFTVTDSRKVQSLDVPWQAVRQVTLIRTDKGPFDDILFYHVVHDGGDITLPDGANNIQAFREHLIGLTGFDMTAHHAAMTSTQINTYSRVFTA